jgi:hypothetical protein
MLEQPAAQAASPGTCGGEQELDDARVWPLEVVEKATAHHAVLALCNQYVIVVEPIPTARFPLQVIHDVGERLTLVGVGELLLVDVRGKTPRAPRDPRGHRTIRAA